MATVVNFKSVKHLWDRESRRWSQPNIVYIGRWNKTYQLLHSPWSNPFVMGAESERAKVIEDYRVYITQQIADGYVDLETLRGKTLVCWCKDVRGVKDIACHGDVLKELLGE